MKGVDRAVERVVWTGLSASTMISAAHRMCTNLHCSSANVGDCHTLLPNQLPASTPPPPSRHTFLKGPHPGVELPPQRCHLKHSLFKGQLAQGFLLPGGRSGQRPKRACGACRCAARCPVALPRSSRALVATRPAGGRVAAGSEASGLLPALSSVMRTHRSSLNASSMPAHLARRWAALVALTLAAILALVSSVCLLPSRARAWLARDSAGQRSAAQQQQWRAGLGTAQEQDGQCLLAHGKNR